MLRRFNLMRAHILLKTSSIQLNPQRKKIIDKSQFPVLNERDLKETFIKGGGPGGQKVNKGNNCVYLLHKPTSLSVKVHDTRYLEQNRKIARQRLLILLDNLINKEKSVENQRKEFLKEKSLKRCQKQRKLLEMKTKWKHLICKDS